ncbi:MAG: efflux RND transporter periplasmic adaptor subunit [Candidatus Micrarchaeia archaeon]
MGKGGGEKNSENKENEKSPMLKGIASNPNLPAVMLVTALLLVAGTAVYLQDMQSKVYIENARIYAPVVSISPTVPGTLEKVYVSEGDEVKKGQKLAQVGSQTLKASTDGVVIEVQNLPGQVFTSATPVVKMMNPAEMRLIAVIEEDKGLRDIAPGQHVVFKADAFSDREYTGTVESISLIPSKQDIVFSISDKRQIQKYEVRVLFDNYGHPELKNGMSAKAWVYK